MCVCERERDHLICSDTPLRPSPLPCRRRTPLRTLCTPHHPPARGRRHDATNYGRCLLPLHLLLLGRALLFNAPLLLLPFCLQRHSQGHVCVLLLFLSPLLSRASPYPPRMCAAGAAAYAVHLARYNVAAHRSFKGCAGVLDQVPRHRRYRRQCLRTHAHTCTRTHAPTQTHKHTKASMQVRTHARARAHTHTHTYTPGSAL